MKSDTDFAIRVRKVLILGVGVYTMFAVPSNSHNDTIIQRQQLRYRELLQSQSDIFKLGFFRFPSVENESYLGLWYNNERFEGDVYDIGGSYLLWTANRDSPILNDSAYLTVNGHGNLKILARETEVITLYSTKASINASAILLDDGNFVLRQLNPDGSVKGTLWQSFEHPMDTLLPGVKLGITTNLTSRISYNSLALGHFTLAYDKGCLKPELAECRRTIHSDANNGYFIERYGSMSIDGFRFNKSDSLTLVDWKKMWLWLTITVGGIMVLPSLFSYCYLIRKKCVSKDENINERMLIKELEGSEVPSIPFGKQKTHKKERNDLMAFSFESIASSTNYFSTANKLGEGGFGPVYTGILHDRREVAIKRLSTGSGQGVTEFKNEELLIAKLQHNNHARLLGFCIQGEEKILIYEYMPNNSLDSFLFGKLFWMRTLLYWICNLPIHEINATNIDANVAKKKILNWKRRFIIIEGIAQGLLYLRKYSRLRVIHKDLKASNILLDDKMKPKISDFGMARIVGQNEPEENTSKVVETYGYISPEYAFHGLVSIKTDVFSFGVLLLKLVSGRKNTSHYHHEHPLNLVGFAWQLWNDDRGLELIDPTLEEIRPHDQILRCVHIGLLCVQDHAVDRPTMSDVVSMLSNEAMSQPKPKEPAFLTPTTIVREKGATEINTENCPGSINHVSISVMEAR
ncbi:hypothetical protein SLEP1_g50677 [Rubroshorea leprosula]|uniref:non-specific serine/threonine protein kinase n=1 Tax=Rubroshorea leprosula TaxID=152421 RepID=A0AAV5M274_9ROSI|nr:hypothetical protein SLEP1_g50677 [Rubroshorea leprosula]